jgi:hypothetical protein
MARTIYVYVEGSDLHEQEARLTAEFSSLAEHWKGVGATLVNQQYDETSVMKPGDLSDWFLGINLPLEGFGAHQAEELLHFLRGIAKSTGREFVVGIVENSGVSEDVVFIGENSSEREMQTLLLHVARP